MKKLLPYLLATFFLQICTQNAFAQKKGQELVDSLQLFLQTAKEDSSKVNILNGLSEHAGWRTGNYDTAHYYANTALGLAKKLEFKKGTAVAYYNNGAIYYLKGNYTESLKNYFAALTINKALDNKTGMAQNYNGIGIVHHYQGNFPEAMKNYFASLKLHEALGNKSGIAKAYNNIAVMYGDQGNYTEALKSLFASVKIKEELGDKRGISESYNNIGDIYLQMGNYAEALKNLEASLKIRKAIGDKYGIAATYQNIGSVYTRQGNYPQALKNLEASLKIREAIGEKRGIAENYNNIGDVYIKSNRTEEGKKWLKKGLALSREIGIKNEVKESYEGLSKADSTLENYRSALENYKLFVLYKDSLYNEESTKKLTQSEMQYEFDKKEALAQAAQEKKDALVDQNIKKQKLVRNGLVGGFAIVLVFASVFLKQRNKIGREKKRIDFEKKRSDDLLLNILPSEVASELKETGKTRARQYEQVSVMFTDFVNFTQTAEKLEPHVLIQELHECFTAFDNIIERNGLEKIKTIGDAYLAVCGLPHPDAQHAQKAVQAGIEIRDFIAERAKKERTFEVRIGIHSGPVVAGVVGVKKFAYDIWGDTVNTAARMESSGEPGKVNISETTCKLVKEDFQYSYRGEITAKNKGKMEMYFVENV